ncbi:unnamed protein product [Gemmataceae bacterium]|nr:unnamed protein product [Gemmataceae bacterium]VTU02485.1 unnamed protein product [Gemmataceae bacterium]
MPNRPRGTLAARLVRLEDRTAPGPGDDRGQVTVYLPRKDGDTQPCGVLSEDRWTRVVLYDASQPDTILAPDR